MLRQVQLTGPLGDKFGREPITFNFDDIRGLMSGLQCIHPDFRAELGKYDELCLMKYVDGQWVSVCEQELGMRFGKADKLVIAAGTKGSAETAAAAIASYFAEAGTAAYAAIYAVAYVAVTVAIAYAASAVMKSLADKPNNEQQERDKHASSLFNGAQNVIEQGGAIPLIYGRHRVGATIISTELSTERQAILMPDTYQLQAGSSLSGNVTSNDVLRDQLRITTWVIGAQTLTIPAGGSSTYNGTGYSVTMSSNGDLFIASTDSNVGADFSFTYTARNTTTNTDATSSAHVQITVATPWEGF